MKIKGDFITNSSSTAFIIFLPEDTTFETLNVDIKSKEFSNMLDSYTEYYHDENDTWEKEDDPEVKKAILDGGVKLFKEFIKDLKVNNSMEYGWCCDSKYHRLGHPTYFKDFIISETETGADNPSQFINLNTNNKFMKEKRDLLRKLLEK